MYRFTVVDNNTPNESPVLEEFHEVFERAVQSAMERLTLDVIGGAVEVTIECDGGAQVFTATLTLPFGEEVDPSYTFSVVREDA